MQLEQPGSALQRGQPAGLKASCARRALLPIAQVDQKGDPGLEPAGHLANVGKKGYWPWQMYTRLPARAGSK